MRKTPEIEANILQLDPGKRPEDMSPHEKKVKALRLRACGWSFTTIAQELGYANPSGAYNLIKRAMDQEVREGVEVARAMELDRLDQLQAAIWDQAIAGDPKSVSAVLSIMDRRARLLGLDSPQALDTLIAVEYINDWRKNKQTD